MCFEKLVLLMLWGDKRLNRLRPESEGDENLSTVIHI